MSAVTRHDRPAMLLALLLHALAPGYDAQAPVDADSPVIVAQRLDDERNDVGELMPPVGEVEECWGLRRIQLLGLENVRAPPASG